VKRLWSWLRYDVLGAEAGGMILAFLVIGAALGIVFLETNLHRTEQGTPVIAVITAFAPSMSTTNPGFGSVHARDDAGLTGVQAVAPCQIAGCEVGDEIRAERVGVWLKLKPAPCPIAPQAASISQSR
jgi:hypothetical protein